MAIINFFQFNVVTQPDPHHPGNTNVDVQPGVHGLFSGGVVMNLQVGVDSVTNQALQAEGGVLPAPIMVKGLLDTGCTVTSIDHSLVSSLGLKVRGYAKTHTANGPVNVTQHLIELGFPGSQLKPRPVQAVQATDLSGQPFQVLIGRDLMAAWSITYNGPAGFVSISE